MAQDPDKQVGILAVTLIFFVLAWVSVGLRCYVRISMLNAFGADDALTICSLIFFTTGIGLTLKGVTTGFGQHLVDLTYPEYSQGIMYWCFAEILYVPTVALIKVSIALYLIRIAVKPIHIWTICLSMALFLTYSVSFFVILLMQCRPISFYWRQALGETDGVCWDPNIVAGVAYGHGGTSVLTDLTLGIIPAFIVADLQITKRTKIAVAFTLALGSVASISTITRIPFLKDLTNTTDYLYEIKSVIILSVVEMAVGIIACCLATLKPLLRSFLDWSDSSLGSTGHLGSRMMDGLSTRRRTRRADDTELQLRPDLKIVGFTTIISSNGRESPPPGHSSLNRSVDIKTETWYAPGDDTSGKVALIEAEPAYYVR
ncbi:hypothetical protein CJF30_00001766 [Rutstroemia sp. NJR-2017a BBW]|nr:hypothetical protein CJF30_00001766 [Rutstroemia sp. NJR-2017a BBW]